MKKENTLKSSRLKIKWYCFKYRYCIKLNKYDSKDYGSFATHILTELILKGDMKLEEFELPIKCTKKILRYYVRNGFIARIRNTQPHTYRIINPEQYNIER